MELPLTTLNATLKFSSPVFNNELGKLVISAAFPAFMGDPNQDMFAEAMAMKAAGVDQVFIIKDGPTRRRFAGDVTLKRGRYLSVCIDDLGNDNGTVTRELLAYYTGVAGHVEVYDLAMPTHKELFEKYCGNSPAGYVIDLHSTPERPNPIVQKLVKAGLAFWEGEIPPVVSIFMPMDIKQETIENVFDLRQLKTQQWLAKFLPKGERVFSKRADKLDSFKDMLPSLTTYDRGGNDFTDKLGGYLRVKGANGLVFPSARCNVKCELYNGELNDYSGWNFVDYRQLNKPFSDLFIDLSPWVDHVGEGITIAYAPDDSPYANSWRIDGKEAWEDGHREFLLKDYYESKTALKSNA